MISITTTTDSFREPLREMLGAAARPDHDVLWAKVLNHSSADPTRAARSLVEKRANPGQLLHMSLEPQSGEVVERATGLRLVEGALRDAGLGNHQAFIVARRQGGHQVLHLLIDRNSGDTAGYHLMPTRLIHGVRQQEALLGLPPGREVNQYLIPPRLREAEAPSAPGLAGVEMRRSGNFYYQVQRLAERPFRHSRSWGELHSRLAEVGLHIQRDPRTDHLSNGVTKRSLWDAAHTSIEHLEKRFGPYKPPSPTQRPEPGRWDQVSRLQEIGYQLASGEFGAHTRGIENQRTNGRLTPGGQIESLTRRQRQLERQIEEGLGRLYKNPEWALRDWRNHDRSYFLEQLATKPHGLGSLREGSWRGQRSALHLVDKGQELQSIERQLRTLRAPSRPHHRHSVQAGRLQSIGAATQELRQIVDKVGWSTAVRVLPVAQLQAVRMALGVTRQTLSKILDPDLARDR